jgi:hypothetical protein
MLLLPSVVDDAPKAPGAQSILSRPLPLIGHGKLAEVYKAPTTTSSGIKIDEYDAGYPVGGS